MSVPLWSANHAIGEQNNREQGWKTSRGRTQNHRPAKTSSCAIATNGYLNLMDWQKIAALAVVAATAGFFLRAKLRRRKFSFEHDTHCGCSTSGPASARTSIVFSARKGGRAKIIVKNN
jgi:hypothetical protein